MTEQTYPLTLDVQRIQAVGLAGEILARSAGTFTKITVEDITGLADYLMDTDDVNAMLAMLAEDMDECDDCLADALRDAIVDLPFGTEVFTEADEDNDVVHVAKATYATSEEDTTLEVRVVSGGEDMIAYLAPDAVVRLYRALDSLVRR